MHSQQDYGIRGKIRTVLQRMWKVARLDHETIMDLKSDPTATKQAVIIVCLAGLSYGLGLTLFPGVALDNVLLGAAAGILGALLIGGIWLSLTFVIGTRLFRGVTTYQGLARPFFFAWSPGLMFIVMSVPSVLVAEVARGVATAWIVIGSVVAVKRCMDLETQQSLLTFILVVFLFLAVLISYQLILSL